MASSKIVLSLLAAGAFWTVGCSGGVQPITSDAALGKVIIYRNGVAYFERYAAVTEGKLSIRVPGERVDDFLKSLTVVDEKTGETMPVAYPTVEDYGAEVAMTIEVPPGHHRVRVAYVTESPAWKPTYRLVLRDEGPARLHAWAVVDNVSGEDWEQVKIGVGSTSALSFRYDLHSVKLVERQTLSPDTLLALAPPTGGSPYAVAGRPAQVLGGLSAADVAELERNKDAKKKEDRERRAYAVRTGEHRVTVDASGARTTRGASGLGVSGVGVGGGGKAPPPMATATARRAPRPPASHSQQVVSNLSNQLRGSGQRVRIEGFAQQGDKSPRHASLERANRLREALILEGIPAGQIDAVGTGRFSEGEVVRVVTEEEKPTEEAPAGTDLGPKPSEGRPVGSAHFEAAEPMSIAKDHSAMVSILNAEAEAERVYLYDPISPRGSKKFAFNAVRFANPSRYMLDSGPFTVYAGSQFLGEGLSEPILPHGTAFVPYALDRSVLADPEVSTREEIDRLLTIQRGIVTTETQRIRQTKLTLTNRGKKPAKVYIRHAVPAGYTLRKGALEVQRLGQSHLLPVTVEAGEAEVVLIEESTPVTKTVDIRTEGGIKAIAVYLKKADLDPALQQKLGDVVQTHTQMADLQERIDVLDEQMAVYRTRVDEINVQLVTLRKVPQAARLRKHLADKMEEISDKLQRATMKMTDLKAELMALQIELQDKVAELTLKRKKKGEAGSSG